MTKTNKPSSPQDPQTTGPRVIEFIESFCRITKGRNAGQLIQLRSWQKEIINELFEIDGATNRRRYVRALLGLPRKNGKSLLGAALALYFLIADGEVGAEIYSVAGTRDQARIVFNTARDMVKMDPQLSQVVKCMQYHLEGPNNSTYKVISADAAGAEGLNPHAVIFDELHVQPNDKLWNTMNLGSGTREQPLVLAITTAGVKTDTTGQDSICYRLYQYGKKINAGEVDDTAFYCRWFEPKDSDCDYKDPEIWKSANPAFGDFLRVNDFENAVKVTPENEFRTKRLNQWVSSQQAWLPGGEFERRADRTRVVSEGTEIVLFFDGSYSGDSTGLVGITIEERPHIFVVSSWEKPLETVDWRIDIAEVEDVIREACQRWQVREVACDPYRWARTMQALEGEGWPIVEYNTGQPARMVTACAKFFDAVMDNKLTHDGDPRLIRHIDNCVLKTDRIGPRIVKENKDSPRKIDLAVCAVGGFDRATFYSGDQGAPDAFFFIG